MFFVIVTISSCSDDSSDFIIPVPEPITEDTWKLNDYNFWRASSVQTSTTYINGDPFTQVNIDSNISNDNASFKTCNLILWFNTSTEGNYTSKSVNTLVSMTTQKFMNIKCLVTNAAGSGATYESTDTNNTIVVTKVDNKFIVTASEPITLTKTYDDGLPNAPSTIIFKCDKVR